MLKGIPKILSPELLKVLCEMGHGDRIVLGDGNFPAESMGRSAILTVFPLDTYVEHPVTLMELMECDRGKVETPIWDEYKKIIAKHDSRGAEAVGEIDRFDFYDEAKKCYAIVSTGEGAIYANVMLQKGVIK